MLLTVDGVTCAYDGTDVLADVSLGIAAGDRIGIVGPNGAGKSTLLRAMSRVLRPRLGRALLEGRDLYDAVTARESARSMAVVPQEQPVAFEFTCLEFVLLGRSPFLGRFEGESARDLEIVKAAMMRTDSWSLRGRNVTEISGGERQRVILARALAQEPKVLLLDEPTSHLDVGHQVALLRVMRELPCAIVAVLHDLNLAAACCRRLLLMKEGRLLASGTPEEVLSPGHLKSAYGTDIDVERRDGRLLVLPRLS